MAPTILPWISEADYVSFQILIPELQKVLYSEWADDHNKAIAYRQSRNGAVNIVISPEAFATWLKATDEPAHLELLWTYAEEKAALDLLAAKTGHRST